MTKKTKRLVIKQKKKKENDPSGHYGSDYNNIKSDIDIIAYICEYEVYYASICWYSNIIVHFKCNLAL
jgi:hypothetical protein